MTHRTAEGLRSVVEVFLVVSEHSVDCLGVGGPFALIRPMVAFGSIEVEPPLFM